jgi:hypothetical protein
MADDDMIYRLAASALPPGQIELARNALGISEALIEGNTSVARAQLAMALNIALFIKLLDRVPSASERVADLVRQGERMCFDHGALRTIDGPTGALPRGYAAFARILEPLGYTIGGLYPLPRLHMTGRAFVHRDMPSDIPQFFVSELHVDQLPESAQAAAERIFDNSTDPLGEAEWELLHALGKTGQCPAELALAGLPGLVRAFGRCHDTPSLADYETLLAHSAEAAWIATEGNAFNHATERVTDVEALAASLKARGAPLKDSVEISANGRVRQTAFLAAKVVREFMLADGTIGKREVPGSFHEFISRDIDPATGALDLTFDSGNATGIFSVTRSA